MSNYRPRYNANPDENHSVVRDFLRDQCGGFAAAPKEVRNGTVMAYTANYRGYSILAIDFSKIGGVLTDWYIEVSEGAKGAWLEVKTEEAYKKPLHDMTTGEMWLYHNCKIDFYVIVTYADVRNALDELLEL